MKNVYFSSKYNNFLFRLLIFFSILFIFRHWYYKRIPQIEISPVRVNLTNSPFSTTKCLSKHDIILNEDKNSLNKIYYRHSTTARNSSYPFISGDTFRAFADFVFDETRQDNLENVKHGDVVFVKADMFSQFFGQPYVSIKNPFVLVTHNSDFYAPREHKRELEDKKIIAWYASNPDLRNHPKIYPIPIGLANTRWAFGNITKFIEAFHKYRKPWSKRTILLYINFSPGTNPGQRNAALAQAKTLKYAHFAKKPMTFENYLEDLGNTKFVLAPPGNGLDCHRTWESLLLGAAPITLTSGLDPLFENIPSVIVQNWQNITDEFLTKINFESYDNFVPLVMYARYWRDTVFRHRNKS